jgi:small-conductance mechanosensitive channel
MIRTMKLRLVAGIICMVAVSFLGTAQTDSAPPSAPPNAQDILDFLNQSITWHQQATLQEAIASEPAGVILAHENRQLADQIIRFSFDFARGQAKMLATSNAAPEPAKRADGTPRYQNLANVVARSETQIKQRENQLDELRQKLASAKPAARRQIELHIAEVESEIDLLQTRATLLRNMMDFASASGGSGNLRTQIDELARTIPALDKASQQTSADKTGMTDSAVTVSAGRSLEPSGIIALISSINRNNRKLRSIDRAAALTEQLAEKSKSLRSPYRAEIRELTKRGDELANREEATDISALQQQKSQIDALTAKLKSRSEIILPLSKQRVLLDVYKRNLANWRASVREQYTADLRTLAVRLSVLGILIVLVLGASELWRRAIFRYVQDARRRYQLLLFRRIAMWFVIAIIIALAFATELGALATFAGLLTAGIAVALQNVILSVAGYFFLIGKYGVRVGDRVQIAGVTGEVIDIGLVRIHLMELGSGAGDGQPSGRVVVFSNSVVFQSNAGLFKQIPGTNFVWHEITLTLAPDQHYKAIEQRLVGAVDSVFSEYRERMERQRRLMEKALHSVAGTTVPENALNPRTRLKLKQTGLEFVISYPVEGATALEMDDRIARALLDAIEREPKLKVVGSGAPNIQPVTAMAEHA